MTLGTIVNTTGLCSYTNESYEKHALELEMKSVKLREIANENRFERMYRAKL